jgi:hypothetical protein
MILLLDDTYCVVGSLLGECLVVVWAFFFIFVVLGIKSFGMLFFMLGRLLQSMGKNALQWRTFMT